MKGIVFNLLEEVVVAQHGEAAWDALLDATELSGAYTSLGSYPDEEIVKLVLAGAGALNLTPVEVLRWFGRSAMPLLAQKYPGFFTNHTSAQSFVLSVNSIIHPEVRKLYTGAHCPFFRFEQKPDGSFTMTYDSPRKLCALAHGFIEGAADHYKEKVEIDHSTCMHHGDDKCILHVRTVSAVTADAA